jgi:hypothetical protein
MPSISYYARGLERPWMIFRSNWSGRDIHPSQNMLGYHREVGNFLSGASVALMTNVPDKRELILNYIQMGIDYYYMGISPGEGDSCFWPGPILLTGLLLNEPDIYNVIKENRIGASVFRDFEKFYYASDRHSTSTSSIVTAGQTWTGAEVFFRKGINQEYEHLHPSEWPSTAGKDESYRNCCDSHPHVGMVLMGLIMENAGYEFKDKWSHNATFDYIYRWMTEPDTVYSDAGMEPLSNMRSSGSSFIDEMWERYRDSVAPSPPYNLIFN